MCIRDRPSATRLSGSDDPAGVIRFWAALGPDAIAIRRGAYGSYVWERRSGQAWHVPILPVEVVDPTGAGNAYGGGYVAGWLHSHDARLAACQATVAAALMLGTSGMPQLNTAARQQASRLLELALARTIPFVFS